MDATTQRNSTHSRTERQPVAHERDEVRVVVMPHGAQPVSEGEARCRAEPVNETCDERGTVCEPMH
jgi:hypothetical protein